MTTPRQVLRGTTVLLTRRCALRNYLLRPGRLTNEVFGYVLAVAARRHGILLHAYCVLSNHYHLVVTDPRARLPRFVQFLNAMVARALNAALDREDFFWDSRPYSAVVLPTPADAADKAAYALANPVAAGLVERGQQWPGLWSNPTKLGSGRIEVRRPVGFFDPGGDLPEREVLELTVPPGFESAEAFRELVETGLKERESLAHRAIKRFLGVARVLAQRVTGRPTKPPPRGGLRPLVASRDAQKRVEVLRRLKAFLGAYSEALCARREKVPGVVFPAGTYQLRVEHGVPCAGDG
jgi:REP element-mobilizing transposase RayT